MVFSVGSVPKHRTGDELKNKNIELNVIGDSREIGRIMEAVHNGYEVGLKIGF